MPVVIDKIKQKNGLGFKLLDAVDVEMPDGKGLDEAIDEIKENADGKLIGNTESTTPKLVANAVGEDKIIRISHSDSMYGVITFTNFSWAINMYLVVASVVFEFSGKFVSAYLVGDVSADTWNFSVTDLAEKKTASAVDLSGFQSEGEIVETYTDGSSLTYNFEFDSEGNPTKITDSDGNETVLTW